MFDLCKELKELIEKSNQLIWELQQERKTRCTESATGLLPCPFCGGQASWLKNVDEYVPTCDTSGCWCTIGAYATKEEAEAAWNRRGGKPV